jgi:hypothetical protein
MDRSPICPTCLSKNEDIHGMVYPAGNHVGERCDDAWHRGAEYDPNRWQLSAFDREFLSEQKVSQR